MDEKYFAQKIERKWQTRWAERGTFEANMDADGEKFYCLEMLPYPSGKLHMGHVRNYSIGDALSWYKRLQGYNVLHPIGWDSFGQPAEQAAIKQGVNPRDWTEANIDEMRDQLKSLGIGYDWSREIAAHRPDYYKFDQWFFLKMLEMGLAYRKDSEVNWCPKCETTLSNEQASGGICWRCGSIVEKQLRPQWFLAITRYADELLDDMSKIKEGWPERVLTMQENWIGRSKGAFIEFKVQGSEFRVKVFTTRIDTIYGVNSIVVAPEHPFIEEFGESFSDEVKAKIEAIKVEQAEPKDYGEEVEKDGIDTGMKGINPFSGEEIPIWVGNYVMMSYGTGAVMSVPAHDERDFDFAKKFGLRIKPVIQPQRQGEREEDSPQSRKGAKEAETRPQGSVHEEDSPQSRKGAKEAETRPQGSVHEEDSPQSRKGAKEAETRPQGSVREEDSLQSRKGAKEAETRPQGSVREEDSLQSREGANEAGTRPPGSVQNEVVEAFTEKGVLVNSDSWTGKTSDDALIEMTQFAENKGFGEGAMTYRLRDWGISRQRFWGAPIPIINCDSCGHVPVPFEDLPVELPESAPFTGVGESPLAKVEEFVNAGCPECGEPAKRETDTMDTFVDSTWYYFRYADPKNEEMPFDSKVASYWLPVDQYIGGIDHAVMHLLYTRFWTKVMRDIGLVDFDEPAKRLLTQGMVVAESFYSKSKESYVFPDDVEIKRDDGGKAKGAKLKEDGSSVRVAVEKMGKSKLNGVDPNDMISIYGSDSVRLFSMFAAPVENELVWQETGIDGAVRFIQRVWRFVYRWVESGRWATGNDDDPNSVSIAELSTKKLEFSDSAQKLRQKTHQTIKRITENFESGQFNTPVAALMELSNAMYDLKVEPENANQGDIFAVREACESLISMLAPYAPHVSEELWEAITGRDMGILESGARFPIADDEIAKADEIEVVVQVNGKLRARVKASPEASNEEVENLALADRKIKEYTEGKEIVKIIVVPGRLVNVVLR